MKTWIATFEGHWHVGTCHVIVAESMDHAIELLEADLEKIGLEQDIEPSNLHELDTTKPCSIIMNDGSY